MGVIYSVFSNLLMKYDGNRNWFAGEEKSIVNESGSDAGLRVD